MILEFPEKKRTPAEEQVYFERLETEKSRLLNELKALRGESFGEVDTADDGPSIKQDQARKEELVNNLTERLEEIENTIIWAREHGFVCSVCGKEIETDRLEADPASITCKKDLGSEDAKLGIAA